MVRLTHIQEHGVLHSLPLAPKEPTLSTALPVIDIDADMISLEPLPSYANNINEHYRMTH
jgi:hypothetical protein